MVELESSTEMLVFGDLTTKSLVVDAPNDKISLITSL
jgi:hypothetical protein